MALVGEFGVLAALPSEAGLLATIGDEFGVG